jgi:energy-coupling factor transport system ATP-binding protein
MPFILKNVHFTYQKGMVFAKNALKGLDFAVQDGEMIGVMGAAGSGKSTFLQLFNALIKPDQGYVLYNDQDLARFNKRQLVGLRQEVGMVFQYPEQQIFADQVYDEIAFGPRNLGLDEQSVERRVQAAMQQVGLDFDEYSQRPTTALSSGEKRRVALAGILALKPRHLLLDEPTAGLDEEGRRAILDHLQQINRQENITVIMVTHNLSHLLICKRLMVIEGGQIALDTPISELLNHYGRLKELGIELPPHLETAYRLLQRGWDIDTSDVSVAAIARQIASKVGDGKCSRNIPPASTTPCRCN